MSTLQTSTDNSPVDDTAPAVEMADWLGQQTGKSLLRFLTCCLFDAGK
jgi:hypothetical protein